MAITTTKTWQFDLNNFVPADTTLNGRNAHFDRRAMLLGIKNALKGFSTLPWTVTNSSNGVDVPSNADDWVDADDLEWRDDDTANVFSWIILRQTGISTTFELLLTCESNAVSSDGAQLAAWVAQAGFTGGSTTVRPTATDERQIRDSTADGFWGSGGNGQSATYRYHCMQSTDGNCTRVLIFIDDVNTGFWAFDKPANPLSAWTDPYVAVISGDNNITTNQCSYSKFHDAATMKGLFSGTDTTMYLSGEGFGTNASGENFTVVNQVNGTFLANEMGLSSLTSTFTGRNGEMFDLWWGLTNAGTGHYYPETGTKSYVQVQHMIFPWDGSTLIGTK